MTNPEIIGRSRTSPNHELNMSRIGEIANIVRTILETDVDPTEYDIFVNSVIRRYDSNTALHSISTGVEAITLGNSLLNSANYKHKDEIDLNRLEAAGIFHDIGKVCIPLEILNSKKKLTEDEFIIMRDHPLYSFEILKKFSPDPEILNAVLGHHEKYDGTGYPNHLKKDEIPVMAQIIAVTDVYDALTSDRSYREKMKPKDAISLMETMDGHFNDEVFKVFLESKKSFISPTQSQQDNGRIQSLPAL